MIRIGMIVATALLQLGSQAAHAATLGEVQGQVLVNVGNGYKIAVTGMELKPGDQVVVNPGGTAQVAYGDCIVPVPIGTISVVASSPPCEPGTTEPLPPSEGLPLAPLAGGAAIAAGALFIIGKQKDKSASP